MSEHDSGAESPPAVETVDPARLRSCLGRFATGVTVVSYLHDDEPRGATVNAFSSVSLEPPLVLVSLARKARACSLLEDRPFTVNVLSSRQIGVAMTFAGRPDDRAVVEWEMGRHAPRLRHTHATIECTPWRSYDGGDHVLYLGRVEELAIRENEPLVFHSGNFHRRGEGLDQSGRSTRCSAPTAAPLDVEAMEELNREYVTGWI
ncbi:flavin reductase family protein [Pseudonocardia parietis]|uniref:Flavin reductase (DIM6/NTAB) family NADH-FMN oxidoreductase RutF n=1 Tax=Pseudonocardia parietis TaxID=570936 RepID=A0ABS4VMA6_9PSEU|nr:flavin reductase family protein [Pseudonocardia parietis]MBP2365061.1 flavin reductase (DIM6/NTAB) family NADH-FMN oxidoreductase RutF [Pseudonocardia parietis]